jgi:hypothetical protein
VRSGIRTLWVSGASNITTNGSSVEGSGARGLSLGEPGEVLPAKYFAKISMSVDKQLRDSLLFF